MGPALVHATVTRPYSHSSADTQSKYRPQAELDDEAWNDPIAVLERALLEGHVLSRTTTGRDARTRPAALVAEAAKEALQAPRPDPATVRLAFARPARRDPARKPQTRPLLAVPGAEEGAGRRTG